MDNISKTQNDHARLADAIYEYAVQNGLTEFVNKWERKSYNDKEPTVYLMVQDLFHELDKTKENVNQRGEKYKYIADEHLIDAYESLVIRRLTNAGNFQEVEYILEYKKEVKEELLSRMKHQ